MLNIRNLSFTLFFLILAFSSQGQVSASFTASPTSGCAPLIVNFTNNSTGATSYSWNFGNLAPLSALTSPGTSYINPGTYTVTLTAMNGSASSTKTMQIVVHPLPTVSFIANDTAVCPGVPVTFLSTSNSNAPGTSNYYWDFGDGYSSTSSNPTHTFPGTGYYNISLTVTNSYGCVSSLAQNAFIHVFTAPVAAFSVSNNYFCKPPAAVVFTNNSTGNPTLTSQWFWGNGNSLISSSPTYTYNSSGSYNVKLIVTDGNGCKDSTTQFGVVYVGNLSAAFTGPTVACIYSTVTFVNTSNNLGANSYWDFGDGSGVSLTPNGVHSYSSSGTFNVRLIIYDGHCYDTVIHPITINPEPVSSFTSTPIHPCPAPQVIQFNSTAPPGCNLPMGLRRWISWPHIC